MLGLEKQAVINKMVRIAIEYDRMKAEQGTQAEEVVFYLDSL